MRRRLAVVLAALAVMGGIAGHVGNAGPGDRMHQRSRTWAADAPTGMQIAVTPVVKRIPGGVATPQGRSWA